MKCLFYFSNSVFPYAALASAMHLEKLPTQPPFSITSITYLPPRAHKKGIPYYAGNDRFGNKVYAVWNAGEPEMVRRIIYSFIELYNIPESQVMFLDVGLKDDLLSLTANVMIMLRKTHWYKLIVEKILYKHHLDIAVTVERSYGHNLTKTTNYQIMLPE